MNHLVFLEPRAGELEQILSGVKSMVLKEFDPAQTYVHPVKPGDGLYFVRNMDDCTLRVKARVFRVFVCMNTQDDELSHTLKEMQPRLRLTEDQYSYWSSRMQLQFVEFDSAHKIDAVHLAAKDISDRSDWIAFDDFDRIAE
jgi:hypothetical protein